MTEVELVEAARVASPSPDLAGHDDVELERLVRTGAAALAAATCRWLELLGEFVVRGTWHEHGATVPSQWLSWAVGVAPSTAREHVRVALALRELPRVREVFAAGRVSYSKVRAITRVATPATEQMLLDWADGAPAHVLDRIVADAVRVQRAGAAPAERDDAGLHCRWRSDGSFELVVRCDAATGLGVEQRIDRLLELADGADGSSGEHGADEDGWSDGGAGGAVRAVVPRAVRAADALVAALGLAVAHGPPDTSGADRHLVVAEVPALVLAAAAAAAAAEEDGAAEDGAADGSGSGARTDADVRAGRPRVAGVGDPRTDDEASRTAAPGAPAGAHPGAATRAATSVAAAAQAARPSAVPVRDGRGRVRVLPLRWLGRLVCAAGLDVAVDGRGGHPADLGRARRAPDARLRRLVRRRDRTCRFPGCAATRHLDVHHVRWWSLGGPTDLGNLVLLCAAHHRAVHVGGWCLRPAGSGAWTFHAPDDRAAASPRPWVRPLPGWSVDAAGSPGTAPAGTAAEGAAPAGAAGTDPGPQRPEVDGPGVASLLVALAAHAHDVAPDALQPHHWDGWGHDVGLAVEVLVDRTRRAASAVSSATAAA